MNIISLNVPMTGEGSSMLWIIGILLVAAAALMIGWRVYRNRGPHE